MRIVFILRAIFAHGGRAVIFNSLFRATGNEYASRSDGSHGDYFGQVLLQHFYFSFDWFSLTKVPPRHGTAERAFFNKNPKIAIHFPAPQPPQSLLA